MTSRSALEQLDRNDPLAPFRDRFQLPDGIIYLDGNSLGPLPRATPGRIADLIEKEWGQGLIRSWNDAGWITLAGRVAAEIAHLVGAAPSSIAVADSTSVNLFKLLGSGLRTRPGRHVILSERTTFPTDLYIAQGLNAFLGGHHTLRLVEPDEIPAAIDENTAIVLLTHVNYRTGAMHDMATITAAAHAKGALILWDLAHSAGAVPVDLTTADADFAVGCGYKFLNGGPGAPAFLYAAPRLHAQLRFPITGWLGHKDPFAFETEYQPAHGLGQASVGTPPILSLAALEVGISIAREAPMSEIRSKSLSQLKLMAELFEQAAPNTFPRVTPTDPTQCGSQLCLSHPHADAIMQALIARGVIGDFRAPDILRFGITPLTLSYADLWDAAEILGTVMKDDIWRDPAYSAPRTVT